MKRLLSVFLSLIVLISSFPVIASESVIKINLNGEELKMDVAPVIVDDRTLVPFRAIIEAIQGEVDFNDANREVFASYNNTEIRLILEDTDAKIKNKLSNNEKIVKLDVPAKLVNNRTLVPVRFMVETFGLFVGWEESTSTVIIINPNEMSKKLSESFVYMPDIFPEENEYAVDIFGDGAVEILGKTINYKIDGKQEVKDSNYKLNFTLKTEDEHFKYDTIVADGVCYSKDNNKWEITPNLLSGNNESIIAMLTAYENHDANLYAKANEFIDFLCKLINESVENLNNEFTIRLNSKIFVDNKDKIEGFIPKDIYDNILKDFDLVVKGTVDNKGMIVNYNVELNIQGIKINLNVMGKATIKNIGEIKKPI